MKLHCGIRNRALAIAFACALVSTAALAQPASSPGGQRETITGTICRLDPRAGTFALLTGVGHSLRVHPIRYAASLRVMANKTEANASALAIGDVCRVECEVSPGAASATRVEVLQPARNP